MPPDSRGLPRPCELGLSNMDVGGVSVVALVICIAPFPKGPPTWIQEIISVSPRFSLAPSTLRVQNCVARNIPPHSRYHSCLLCCSTDLREMALLEVVAYLSSETRT